MEAGGRRRGPAAAGAARVAREERVFSGRPVRMVSRVVQPDNAHTDVHNVKVRMTPFEGSRGGGCLVSTDRKGMPMRLPSTGDANKIAFLKASLVAALIERPDERPDEL